MALAIRASFAACLASKSHVAKVMAHPEGQYKIVKAVDPIFDTMEVVAKASNASEATLAGLAYGRMTARRIRDILSVIYIVTEVVPSFVCAFSLFRELIQKIGEEQEVHLNRAKKKWELAYGEIAKGNLEKCLNLVALSGKCVKGVSSTFATFFHLISDVENSQTALVIKHGSGTLGLFFEMGYHYVAFRRALAQGEPREPTYQLFKKKMGELSVGTLENGLQLIYYLAKKLQSSSSSPPWFRLPLTFLIAGLGLYKVWLKTEEK
jgi:hypothetical protein